MHTLPCSFPRHVPSRIKWLVSVTTIPPWSYPHANALPLSLAVAPNSPTHTGLHTYALGIDRVIVHTQDRVHLCVQQDTALAVLFLLQGIEQRRQALQIRRQQLPSPKPRRPEIDTPEKLATGITAIAEPADIR